jgi:hypothetical protein
MQSVSAVQVVMHAVGPHTNSWHDLGTSAQLPAPSQKLEWCSIPLEQLFALQVVDEPG